jgi:uncharacterized protein YdaU (DUF1376 family)
MSTTPAFQFYVNDWLSSTKISTMTPSEEGAYIRLLCYCWNDPDCTLPDDDEVLARLSRLGEGWFNGGSTALRRCFMPHPKKPGRLFNSRLLDERKKQEAWRKKSREGGIQSGKTRAKTRDLKEKSGGSAVEGWLKNGSTVVRSKREPKGNSSSSSSVLKTKNKTLVLNGHMSGFNIFWMNYPRKKSKGQAEKAWTKLQPDDVLLGLMLGKLDQAKQTPQWTKDNGEFIPHPASWLNSKGWEDEFSAPKKERLPL